MLEFAPLFNLVLALIILLLISGVFVVYQLKAMRVQLSTASYKLYFETTRKADLLPQAVTRLQEHSPDFSFDDLIVLRQESLNIKKFDRQKKEAEDRLWALFNQIWEESRKWPGVKTDHLLSALETDLSAADERIEEMKIGYNRLVVKNNNLAGNILLKPAALIAGAKVLVSY